MRILSLGWGTQSVTLAAMSVLGEIEPIDFAIHADTTHERTATYAFAKRWTPWLEERGMRVVTVQPKQARVLDLSITKIMSIPIPAFTLSGNSHGQVQRQCTGDWKIAPIRRYIQSVRMGQPVEQWIGISLDEFQRMKPSDVKYITNRWPLVEKRMTRYDCQLWLERHGLEIPTRSACVFCPFHSRAEWRDIRDNAPDDWAKAVEVDSAIRKARPPYDLFVNVQRRPLAECDLSNQVDAGQLSLWENECQGVCGI